VAGLRDLNPSFSIVEETDEACDCDHCS
jgi:hypothetical protein